MGMLEAVGEVFPEAKYQRCIVHFYRNVFSVVPKSKMKTVAQMLKAIHAQESKKAAREKARMVKEELKAMKLKEAAQKIENGTFYQRAAAGCTRWSGALSNTVIWLCHTCPKASHIQPHCLADSNRHSGYNAAQSWHRGWHWQVLCSFCYPGSFDFFLRLYENA